MMYKIVLYENDDPIYEFPKVFESIKESEKTKNDIWMDYDVDGIMYIISIYFDHHRIYTIPYEFETIDEAINYRDTLYWWVEES